MRINITWPGGDELLQQRQGAVKFLSTFSEFHLAAAAITSLQQGETIENAGEKFASQLKGIFTAIEKQTQDAAGEAAHWRACYENYRQSQSTASSLPLQKMVENNLQELHQTRQSLLDAKDIIRNLECERSSLQQQLDLMRTDYQKQMKIIQDLNRIVARQHLQLVELLGGEYAGLPALPKTKNP